MNRITILCFTASYAVGLLLELLQLFRPRAGQRWLAAACGSAGLLAHTIFLAVQRPPLAAPFGTVLFLAWILAVFYLYGSLHHRQLAWGVFVLPVVFGLSLLAASLDRPNATPSAWPALLPVPGERFWSMVHGSLLLLAAVGVCVAFVASLMYLVQAHRLKTKVVPGKGLRLLSLERIDEMNRRAVNLAFPLLTAGMLVGAALMLQDADYPRGWLDPKILSSLCLWLVFVILLFLRYGVHLRGRRAAVLTIMAFVLLVLTLATPSHSFLAGGVP